MSYAFKEWDPYDEQYYRVSGGGDFNGPITATGTNLVATTHYVGSSNWCLRFEGIATITSY